MGDEARSAILGALRRGVALAAPAGESATGPARPSADVEDGAVADYVAALERAAGVAHRLGAGETVASAVADRFAGCRDVYAADGLGLEPYAIPAAPTGFANLEVAVARAAFGVIENGALWVDGECGVERAALWLCKHLVLVVARDQLAADMHAAYRRLAAEPMPAFGAFIAGPSKTADIEQCLVIGAHGPLSLDVWLV